MNKKCKGTGKAIDNGCGLNKQIFRYGLCKSCFIDWLYNTKKGNETLHKSLLASKKKVFTSIERTKKANHKKAKESLKTKSNYENELQTLINWIVREIDKNKGCISCEHGWGGNFTRQRHAGHRLSVGSTPELRFNVLNIFGQCSICNNYLSGNSRKYDEVLQWCYGIEFYDIVVNQRKLYTGIKLTIEEIKEAIKEAKILKKDIIKGKEFSRIEINNKIGIYTI